ncbi:hypothetical protein PAPYR_10689 [Paratrimastix pyriformis]|uniref:Uncharacterized protein n=1 Tax=Paratrimastix pyriformis TaxID=342808 RepID=A0ABQ8U775_9EUKA|nr:hypothetical protein PAPYR_10689 [Paratrimastix pyriformis]
MLTSDPSRKAPMTHWLLNSPPDAQTQDRELPELTRWLFCGQGVHAERGECPTSAVRTGVALRGASRGLVTACSFAKIAYTPNGVYIDRGMFTHHTCLHGHSEGRCHAVCLYTHQPVRHCYPVGVLESGLCCALLRGTRVGVVPERPCVLIMSWDMSWHTIVWGRA